MPLAGLDVRGRALASFAAIYLIWGSTYLAIRYGVETIPPYLMTGVRCLVAGGALFAWAAWRGDARPSVRGWAAALVVGTLLFVVGQGVLSWAETRVPSGPAALLIATIPVWMVLLDWLRPGGSAPAGRVWAGIAVGLLGVLALMGPSGGRAGVDPLGGAACSPLCRGRWVRSGPAARRCPSRAPSPPGCSC